MYIERVACVACLLVKWWTEWTEWECTRLRAWAPGEQGLLSTFYLSVVWPNSGLLPPLYIPNKVCRVRGVKMCVSS